jgi:E3 ubiquitin-protein ligase HUWE1
MNALTNKTSSQAFFLRVLKVIIQLRDAALHAMKKSKLASEAVAKKAKEAEVAAAATASAAAATSPNTESSMEVSEAAGTEAPAESPSDGATSAEANTVAKEPSLPSLSDELLLNTLWDTLSACLRDLADTPDHHAVLVLQATVEAFFLVHAAPTQPEDKKKVQQKETRQEQLAHIQEQNTIIGTSENPSEPATGAHANAASGGAAASGQSNTASNAVAVSNAAAEAGEARKAEAELSVETQKFLAFAETHRTVLNQILRQSTVHLADGPFSVLVDHTRVLDFDIKRR